MSKTCLIVSDDPATRQTLRGLLSAYGLGELEAAGLETARACLKRMPHALIIVESEVSGGEDLAMLFNDLPRERDLRPKCIYYSVPGQRHSRDHAHPDVEALKADIAEDTLGDKLVKLGILDRGEVRLDDQGFVRPLQSQS